MITDMTKKSNSYWNNPFDHNSFWDMFQVTTGYAEDLRKAVNQQFTYEDITDKIVYSLVIPGVKKEDLEVILDPEGVLSARWKDKNTNNEVKCSVNLNKLDLISYQAKLEDGILTVSFDKKGPILKQSHKLIVK